VAAQFVGELVRFFEGIERVYRAQFIAHRIEFIAHSLLHGPLASFRGIHALRSQGELQPLLNELLSGLVI
jgi:hypothetical protein